MGAWGDEPWENDGAADWLAELFDAGALRRRVLDGLNKVYEYDGETESAPEVSRIAAHLLVSLANVWPAQHREADLRLAETKLRALIDDGDFEGQGYEGEALELVRGELERINTVLGVPPERAFHPNPAGLCCPFTVSHTEHVELAEPVIYQRERLRGLLGAEPEPLHALVRCMGWLVVAPGETDHTIGELISEGQYVQLRGTAGFHVETGARAVLTHLPEDVHPQVLLTRIPDLAGFAKPLRAVVRASDRLLKLAELGAPPVILRNQRLTLQRAVDQYAALVVAS